VPRALDPLEIDEGSARKEARRGGVSLRAVEEVDGLARIAIGEPEAGTPSERAARLEATLLLASFESWDRLRSLQGLSPIRARRALEQVLRQLLERSR